MRTTRGGPSWWCRARAVGFRGRFRPFGCRGAPARTRPIGFCAEYKTIQDELKKDEAATNAASTRDETFTAKPGSIEFRIIVGLGDNIRQEYQSLDGDPITATYASGNANKDPRQVSLAGGQTDPAKLRMMEDRWNRSVALPYVLHAKKAGYDRMVARLKAAKCIENVVSADEALKGVIVPQNAQAAQPAPAPAPAPAQGGERYVTATGASYVMTSNDGRAEWVSSEADGSNMFRDSETSRDQTWITLFEPVKSVTVALPVAGGMVKFTLDGGKTWNDYQNVQKANGPGQAQPPPAPAQPAQGARKHVAASGYAFTMSVVNGKTEWVGAAADGSGVVRYAETSRDQNWVQAFDAHGNVTIAIPTPGGIAQSSTDGGQTWNPWIEFRPAQ